MNFWNYTKKCDIIKLREIGREKWQMWLARHGGIDEQIKENIDFDNCFHFLSIDEYYG